MKERKMETEDGGEERRGKERKGERRRGEERGRGGEGARRSAALTEQKRAPFSETVGSYSVYALPSAFPITIWLSRGCHSRGTTLAPSTSSVAIRLSVRVEKKARVGLAPEPRLTDVPVTTTEPSGEKSHPVIGSSAGKSPHAASGASSRLVSHSLRQPSVEREANVTPSLRHVRLEMSCSQQEV